MKQHNFLISAILFINGMVCTNIIIASQPTHSPTEFQTAFDDFKSKKKYWTTTRIDFFRNDNWGYSYNYAMNLQDAYAFKQKDKNNYMKIEAALQATVLEKNKNEFNQHAAERDQLTSLTKRHESLTKLCNRWKYGMIRSWFMTTTNDPFSKNKRYDSDVHTTISDALNDADTNSQALEKKFVDLKSKENLIALLDQQQTAIKKGLAVAKLDINEINDYIANATKEIPDLQKEINQYRIKAGVYTLGAAAIATLVYYAWTFQERQLTADIQAVLKKHPILVTAWNTDQDIKAYLALMDACLKATNNTVDRNTIKPILAKLLVRIQKSSQTIAK